MSDLADLVYDHMAAHATDNDLCGFTVSQHTGTPDDVAVTFRPGVVDATPAVLSQTLHPWADGLRGAGFAVDVEYAWPGKEEPSRIPGCNRIPLWLHVTGYEPQPPAGAAG